MIVHSITNTIFSLQPGYYCLGFAPVIDGEFIPDYPGNIRKDGNHHQGPLIQGQCTDDGSPYSLSCKTTLIDFFVHAEVDSRPNT